MTVELGGQFKLVYVLLVWFKSWSVSAEHLWSHTTEAISCDYKPLFPGSVWYESYILELSVWLHIFPRKEKRCTAWNYLVKHKTIEKKDFVSFPLQKYSHNFWLAFIIPQHAQLRKSMLAAAKSCGFGAAESRADFSKPVDWLSSPMEDFTSSTALKSI